MMPLKFNLEQQNEIIQKYQIADRSLASLAREYEVNIATIISVFKRRGLNTKKDVTILCRTYHMDDAYFNHIDTEEKAYFLGFLYADGNVSSRNNSIKMKLQERDCAILERFSQAIGLVKPLEFRPKEKETYQNQLGICFSSEMMKKDLIRLGCPPRKSMILEFPTPEQVPDDLIRHFIRGYFDGDGCVCLRKFKKSDRTSLDASIVGTFKFCEKLDAIVRNFIDVRSKFRVQNPKANNITSSWVAGSTVDSRKFLTWLYDGATIYLQRKYDKFTESCQIMEDKKEAKKFEAFGGKKTKADWIRDSRCVVKYRGTLTLRLKQGMSMEEAITTPSQSLKNLKPRTKKCIISQ